MYIGSGFLKTNQRNLTVWKIKKMSSGIKLIGTVLLSDIEN
jgi:hypothetical protein